MKQISTKSKILVVIITLVIVIGAVIVGIKGFNFDIRSQASQKIELYIEKSFEISDIKQITDEVLKNQSVLIQKVEVYEDQVSITAKEITDEQKSNIVDKINEKYGTELKAEDIDVKNIPHTKFRDIVNPYILPLVISTGVILIYIGIRFHSIGIFKTILKVVVIVALAEAILFALMAITRFPIGRYTLPLVLFVYLVSILGITIKLENILKTNKAEEKSSKI